MHMISEAKTRVSEKKWDGAVTSATEAIHLSPESPAAYVTRSGAYANGGHLSEALADAETAIRKNPDEGMGYNSRGYVYELMKKPRQAILDYEIACSLKFDIGCDSMNSFNTGVWTRDAHELYQVPRAIQAGRVWVNCYHAYPAHAPFGGYKKSGFGRENHKMMLGYYRQTKNMLISYSKNKLGFF